jgi:hypothetical protein
MDGSASALKTVASPTSGRRDLNGAPTGEAGAPSGEVELANGILDLARVPETWEGLVVRTEPLRRVLANRPGAGGSEWALVLFEELAGQLARDDRASRHGTRVGHPTTDTRGYKKLLPRTVSSRQVV